MEKIEWQEGFTIGIPSVDAEHKNLLHLYNGLIEEAKSGKNSQKFKEALGGLILHSRKHFVSEEDLMKKIRYPKLGHHVAQHSALVKQIVMILEGIREDKDVLKPEVMQFMKKWLVQHMLGDDKELGQYYHTIHWIDKDSL